jgi:bifunctional non-homologous end joining protein LigD
VPKTRGKDDKLETYRGKRKPDVTPEPVPEHGLLPQGNNDTFVIQEHHARRLHWDFRLERDGVLVSWAVPKGLPLDPKTNHLAVHMEDHPLEYATFEGEIPAGEYGGGKVILWDRGTYTTEKWEDDEVKVVLNGERIKGRYVLFQTDGKNWMIHRMDPPPSPDWQPLPSLIKPMLATPGELPSAATENDWAYEMKWDGVRAIVYVEGGRAKVMTRNDRDVTGTYPELTQMAESLGARQLVLDGEIVALDRQGRPDFGLLQQRMHVIGPSQVRSLVKRVPVSYLAFDLLYTDGRLLLDRTYDERRSELESLDLEGSHWGVPPAFPGDGAAAVKASQDQHLEGVVAKRRNSTYEPGRRSRSWLKVKNVRTQEVVIGGWRPGAGRRSGTIGSLLLGIPDESGLKYVGHVGTGFTDAMLADLLRQLKPLQRETSPFSEELPRPDARDAVWIEPKLVGEVAFSEWTHDERLRHPSWRGLRPDKDPESVVRES